MAEKTDRSEEEAIRFIFIRTIPKYSELVQKYQQIEINKEEFKNLVTRKINNVNEFSGNRLELRSEIQPSKTMSGKTPVKI